MITCIYHVAFYFNFTLTYLHEQQFLAINKFEQNDNHTIFYTLTTDVEVRPSPLKIGSDRGILI